MSNLSDLLPAGAGGKQVSFVASGAIGNGVTVALNSDGTVSAAVSQFSSGVVFESADSQLITSVYDTTADKVVVAYKDNGNSNYGTAVVGTVSGGSISFGTPVVFESGTTNSLSIVFDSLNNKIVCTYSDGNNGAYLTCVVGTVSGTSISFGTPVVASSEFSQNAVSTFDSNLNKVVLTWTQLLNSNNGRAVVGTVSGTSISFGTAVDTDSGVAALFRSIVFDSVNNKVVIIYRDGSDSDKGAAVVGTVSGTSISFGTPVTYSSASVGLTCMEFDVNAGKVVVIYQDTANSSYGTGVVGTVSGTSISFGSPTAFNSISTTLIPTARTYDSSRNKCLFVYRDSTNGRSLIEATVSGTSVSFSTPNNFDAINEGTVALSYDPDQNKTVISYRDGDNLQYGTSILYDATKPGTANFIGISDAAISDTASGSVTIKGGVAGSVAYSSGPGAITDWTTADYTNHQHSIAYDVNAQKLVIFYSSGVNSNNGYYVVGTVSGVSLSFGTPGLVSAVSVQWMDITYDANSQKVVAVYNNGSDLDHGYAVVGTVSGTSISWGTPVKFEAGAVYYNSAVYDSSSQKVVISYYDSGNSNYGTSIVGTVSGTSISFGTAVVFESASTSQVSSTFDSTNNKIIIGYRDVGNSNYGTAIVGTVSGTSISFGSPTVFEASATDVISLAYDANANKVVVAYRDTANSNAGTAVVGTVSGTSISFGSPVVFQASGMASQLNDITAQYDPSTQTVLIGFRDSGDSNYGKTVVGTVSGTSISFTTPTTFNENTTQGIVMAYASNQQKMVIAFDQEGTVPDTKAFVYTPDTTLTPNTDYYVQTDGSLSTTVSSVLAGKALSSTSINLDYTS